MPKRRNRPVFGDLVQTYEGLKTGKRMVVQGGLLVKGGGGKAHAFAGSCSFRFVMTERNEQFVLHADR
jgi:hypothetical protein